PPPKGFPDTFLVRFNSFLRIASTSRWSASASSSLPWLKIALARLLSDRATSLCSLLSSDQMHQLGRIRRAAVGDSREIGLQHGALLGGSFSRIVRRISSKPASRSSFDSNFWMPANLPFERALMLKAGGINNLEYAVLNLPSDHCHERRQN